MSEEEARKTNDGGDWFTEHPDDVALATDELIALTAEEEATLADCDGLDGKPSKEE